MDAEALEGLLDEQDPDKKSREIESKLIARLRKHKDNPKFVALGERFEKLKGRDERGLLHSLDFLKELLTMAKEVVQVEKQVDPVDEQARAKAALTELLIEVKNNKTPRRTAIPLRFVAVGELDRSQPDQPSQIRVAKLRVVSYT